MKRLAFEKTCGYLLLGVLSLLFLATDAQAQYYGGQGASSNQAAQNKLPLNQLPPIVSSDQATSNSKSPTKGLYIPPNVGNLPPIVSPPQYKAPFVYQQTTAPENNQVPIVRPNTSPTNSALPPVISGNANNRSEFIPREQSQAGVPIYQNRQQLNSKAQTPAINPAPFGNSSFQGSGNRNAPAIQTPVNNNLPPTITAPTPTPTPTQETPLPNISNNQGLSSSLSPAELPAVPDVELNTPGVSVVDPAIGVPLPAEGSGSFPSNAVTEGVPGSNNFFEQPYNAPGFEGVNTGCSSCGPGGCYDPAQVQAQNGCCGSVVNAGYYLFADALFWTRADGDVQLSNFFGLNDYNYVGGYRFTLGFRQNATRGRELTFFGTGDLDEAETANNAAGNLNALFNVSGGISASGFFNAVTQTQTKSTQLHSLEYNRIRWGWDVLKSFIGIRYIYFDDSYSLFSTNVGGTNGLFVMDSVNNLFGVHGGWELFYDVGYRTSASLNAKFGGYVNAANFDTNVFNAGMQVLAQEVDDGAAASTFELGFLSHLQVSPRSRFRLGYDLFLMWGAFTIENNIPRNTFARGFQTGTPQLNPMTGTNLNTNNEPLFLHGVSFGFEVFR